MIGMNFDLFIYHKFGPSFDSRSNRYVKVIEYNHVIQGVKIQIVDWQGVCDSGNIFRIMKKIEPISGISGVANIKLHGRNLPWVRRICKKE